MKFFLIILLVLCFSLTGCGNDNSTENQEQNNSYTASRITTTDNDSNANNNFENNNTSVNNIASIDTTNVETELSSFSTKIYTPNDESRQNNIRITCSKLNGTVVRSRRNFFFL